MKTSQPKYTSNAQSSFSDFLTNREVITTPFLDRFCIDNYMIETNLENDVHSTMDDASTFYTETSNNMYLIQLLVDLESESFSSTLEVQKFASGLRSAIKIMMENLNSSKQICSTLSLIINDKFSRLLDKAESLFWSEMVSADETFGSHQDKKSKNSTVITETNREKKGGAICHYERSFNHSGANFSIREANSNVEKQEVVKRTSLVSSKNNSKITKQKVETSNSLFLKECFRHDRYISKQTTAVLADHLGLSKRDISLWFANKRRENRRRPAIRNRVNNKLLTLLEDHEE